MRLVEQLTARVPSLLSPLPHQLRELPLFLLLKLPFSRMQPLVLRPLAL